MPVILVKPAKPERPGSDKERTKKDTCPSLLRARLGPVARSRRGAWAKEVLDSGGAIRLQLGRELLLCEAREANDGFTDHAPSSISKRPAHGPAPPAQASVRAPMMTKSALRTIVGALSA